MALSPLVASLAGGALIGLASGGLMLTNGRVAGISGIVGGALVPVAGDRPWRAAFVAGLVAGGLAWLALDPGVFDPGVRVPLPVLAVAGVCVGVGTQLGNGCTSGHGVCGLARLSPRSLAAVLTFMAVASLVVTLVRRLAPALAGLA